MIIQEQRSSSKFFTETYFIWFSAIIFVTELISDLCLVIYYLHASELEWGLITFAIIVFPLIMCQLISIAIAKCRNEMFTKQMIFAHLMLLGIPFRYQQILQKFDKNKILRPNLIAAIYSMFKDVRNLETCNAFFQYLPQFLFQAYVVIFEKYKCILTGISAGLAGFSFAWYIILHFYYCCKSFDFDDSKNTTMIIHDETPLSRNETLPPLKSFVEKDLNESIKNYEKPKYKTYDKNFVTTAKSNDKNVEKNKLFLFKEHKDHKRKEHLERTNDTYEFCDPMNNLSTVFYETDDSQYCSPTKFNVSIASKNTVDFQNENNSNYAISGFDMKKPILKLSSSALKLKDLNISSVDSSQICPNGEVDLDIGIDLDINHRAGVMKRKAICSSQEMLHLFDIMQDIPPEEIDSLAKSLIEMGGDESLKPDSEASITVLENLPNKIDEKILENIDAAIYENQVIFQERIRKNQLTIQNLKLQDQLLQKYIDDMKDLPPEILNIQDYENMYFVNSNIRSKLKHWRNYLQDINTNAHDNSTVQNTMSMSTMTDAASVVNSMSNNEEQSLSLPLSDNLTSTTSTSNNNNIVGNQLGNNNYKKNYRWNGNDVQNTRSSLLKHNQLHSQPQPELNNGSNGEEELNEIYPSNTNILVETIKSIKNH